MYLLLSFILFFPIFALSAKFENTNAEFDSFNSLYTVYKMVEKKNKIRFDIIEKTQKSFKDSKLEPDAYIYLEKLKSILKSNSLETISYCDINKTQLKNKLFIKQLNQICDEKVLNLIKVNNEAEINNLLILYFENSLDRLIKSDHLIKILNTNFKHKAKVSELVSNFLIKNPQYLNNDLIKLISPNSELSRVIQLSNIDLLGINNEFSKELSTKVETIILAADNEVDASLIKREITNIIGYFKANISIFNNNKDSRTLLYLGKSLNNRNYPDSAREIYSYLIYSKNKYVFEKSHFEILWTHLKDLENKKAYELALKLKIDENLHTFKNSKIHFWMAFLYSQFDEKNKAINIFQNLIKKNPLAYYSIIASKKILELEKDHEVSSFYHNLRSDKSAIETSSLTEHEFTIIKRISIWGKLGYLSFLNNELRYLNLKKHSTVKKNQLYLNTASALAQSKNHLESFKIIYKGLSKKLFTLNHEVLNILYPQSFLEEILNYKDEIDPIIVISLMRQESAFNPNATSMVGARGLMQLMPYTAKRVLPGTNSRNIADPKRNIKTGVKYLTSLLKRYENNLVYTLAAYNAGENRVKRWRENLFKTDSTLHTIEAIPFKETKQYVKLIFRNIFFYHLILEKNNQVRNPETINTL